MTQSKTRKRLGLFLIIGALIGLLFSVIGITTPWIVKPRIEQNLLESLELFDETLQTTGEGLSVMDSTIENAKTDLTTIVATFENVDSTFDSVTISLTTSATLIGDDLRTTVNDTQVALASSATSAELIDKTLTFLSKVPLIGVNYQPEVPLHISLTQVADSFDSMPGALEDIEQGLDDTSTGLETLRGNLSTLTEDILLLDDDLEDAQSVLASYQTTLDKILTRTKTLQDNLSIILTLSCLFISGAFLSLGTAQVSTILLGLQHYRSEEQTVNLSDIKRD